HPLTPLAKIAWRFAQAVPGSIAQQDAAGLDVGLDLHVLTSFRLVTRSFTGKATRRRRSPRCRQRAAGETGGAGRQGPPGPARSRRKLYRNACGGSSGRAVKRSSSALSPGSSAAPGGSPFTSAFLISRVPGGGSPYP